MFDLKNFFLEMWKNRAFLDHLKVMSKKLKVYVFFRFEFPQTSCSVEKAMKAYLTLKNYFDSTGAEEGNGFHE